MQKNRIQDLQHACIFTLQKLPNADTRNHISIYTHAYTDTHTYVHTTQVRTVLKDRSKGNPQKAEEDFMSVQRGLEDMVAISEEAAELARNAYMSFIR